MSFAIYRTEKLKSFGEIGGSLSHTYRTRNTPNADENRIHLNEHSLQTYNQCFEAIKKSIPEKRRSNAVLCIEHLITASPTWEGWGTEKEKEFFDKSLDFVKKKYGSENVIAHSIHRDETTPHLIVYVTPIDENGGLNAKKWLGGRAKLSQTQTEFANHVKELGLERGLQNSKARHKTIKEFYAEIQKPVSAFKNKNVLEIEMLDPSKDQPKLEGFDRFCSKKEYGELLMSIVYDNVQKQIDTFNDHAKANLSEMHINFEKKIADQKMRADKFQKAYEKIVYEVQGLKKEHEAVTEYKRLFPEKFKELEQSLRDDVKDYYLKIEQEKRQRQYESEIHLEKQRQAAIKKEKEFRNSISLKRDMRLDDQYDLFLQKLAECSSEPEKKAVMQLHDERKANLTADPIDVMNEILKSDTCKSHFYFTACLGLFKIKSEYDFEHVLKDTINCFERDVGSIYEGSTIRKVCAAALNQLDNLLMMYGSKYEDHAEILSNHLIACDEKAEQSIFPDVLEYFVTEERLEKNRIEMAAIDSARDLSQTLQSRVSTRRTFEDDVSPR
jgi:hypothetical protein